MNTVSEPRKYRTLLQILAVDKDGRAWINIPGRSTTTAYLIEPPMSVSQGEYFLAKCDLDGDDPAPIDWEVAPEVNPLDGLAPKHYQVETLQDRLILRRVADQEWFFFDKENWHNILDELNAVAERHAYLSSEVDALRTAIKEAIKIGIEASSQTSREERMLAILGYKKIKEYGKNARRT
jgi:hypothetical protein